MADSRAPLADADVDMVDNVQADQPNLQGDADVALSNGHDPEIVKSEEDKKAYRMVTLPNGLITLLIYDPEIAASGDDDEDDDEEEDEEDEIESEESDEEMSVAEAEGSGDGTKSSGKGKGGKGEKGGKGGKSKGRKGASKGGKGGDDNEGEDSDWETASEEEEGEAEDAGTGGTEEKKAKVVGGKGDGQGKEGESGAAGGETTGEGKVGGKRKKVGGIKLGGGGLGRKGKAGEKSAGKGAVGGGAEEGEEGSEEEMESGEEEEEYEGDDEEDEDDSDGDDDEEDDDDDDDDQPGAAKKLAAAAMCVGVGSFLDPPDALGLAHFLEHMLFMGSVKFPDENEYDSFLRRHGGGSNAFTETEFTCYHFDVAHKYLHPALDRFAQFFVAPLVKADAMEREVQAVDSEFNISLQSDVCRVQQLQCSTCVQPDHPFRKFSWGNRKSLIDDPAKLGVDMRERLLQLYSRFYTAGAMRLVVVGGEPLDTLESWVRQLFSPIPPDGSGIHPLLHQLPPPATFSPPSQDSEMLGPGAAGLEQEEGGAGEVVGGGNGSSAAAAAAAAGDGDGAAGADGGGAVAATARTKGPLAAVLAGSRAASEAGRLYEVASVKEQQQVSLMWTLPCLHAEYASKPHDYLSHLIGHAGVAHVVTPCLHAEYASKPHDYLSHLIGHGETRSGSGRWHEGIHQTQQVAAAGVVDVDTAVPACRVKAGGGVGHGRGGHGKGGRSLLHAEYASKPHDYLSHLIGHGEGDTLEARLLKSAVPPFIVTLFRPSHIALSSPSTEGSGSLLSLLKAKGWATELALLPPSLLHHPLLFLPHSHSSPSTESSGSLLSLLKAKGWATELAAGVGESGYEKSSLAFVFTVTITLSDDGLKHALDVVGTVFQYITMLRLAPPQRWVFEELQAIAAMDLRFAEEDSPDEYAVRLAGNMFYYPKRHVIAGDYIHDKWDPDRIAYLLSLLSPHSVRLDLLTHSFDHTREGILKEPWFDVPYTTTLLSPALLDQWASDTWLSPDLRMPPPNEFIPTDFSLRPSSTAAASATTTTTTTATTATASTTMAAATNSSDPLNGTTPSAVSAPSAPSVPRVVREEAGRCKVWFKQDDVFRSPRLNAHFALSSPHACDSPRSAALTELAVKLIEDSLNETLYLASVAKLDTNMAVQGFKIEIRITGFSHKLPTLAARIFRHISTFRAAADRFSALKEERCRAYRNALLKPLKHSAYLRLLLLRTPAWTIPDKLSALTACEVDDLNAFLQTLFSRTYIEMLIHGNATEEDALALASAVTDTLPVPSPPLLDLPSERCLQLPRGKSLLVESPVGNPAEENSAVEVYYQACQDQGRASIRDRSLVDLLEQVMSEPLFDTLRTKEQLGYRVDCGTRLTHGVFGFCIRVQSADYGPGFLQQRVDSFLNTFRDNLSALPEADFRAHRAALQVLKMRKDHTLGDETHRYWEQIWEGSSLFNSRQLEAVALCNITLAELCAWFDRHISMTAGADSDGGDGADKDSIMGENGEAGALEAGNGEAYKGDGNGDGGGKVLGRRVLVHVWGAGKWKERSEVSTGETGKEAAGKAGKAMKNGKGGGWREGQVVVEVGDIEKEKASLELFPVLEPVVVTA
ncbi:unnamed protein product [Closterium sp. Naga37s-1]|nr:unnamed protein product [Closterium sp. Naga37s-1]